MRWRVRWRVKGKGEDTVRSWTERVSPTRGGCSGGFLTPSETSPAAYGLVWSLSTDNDGEHYKRQSQRELLDVCAFSGQLYSIN